MVTFKEKIEKSLVIWFLGALAAGFVAGFGAYKTILLVAGLVTMPEERKHTLENTAARVPALEQQVATFSAKKQYWLVLHKVEGERNTLVRIEITVNGVTCAYPARGVWAEIGPSMSEQRVPLVMAEEGFRVAFRGYYRHAGLVPVEEAVSQTLHDVVASAIPTEKKIYVLFPSADTGTGAEPVLRVHYSLVMK